MLRHNQFCVSYFNPRSPSGLRLFYINYLINWLENFNPRSPSGLRPSSPNSFTTKFTFQSTQPEWAATSSYPKSLGFVIFQSTQPEWAATKLFVSLCLLNFDFNPRSPSGLRLRLVRSLINCLLFQSTQPEWAATVTTT